MKASSVARLRRIMFATLLAGCGAVFAGPQEDYKAGQRAYNEGDFITAMSQLKRAADEGFAPAQALLAYILDKSEFDEEAVTYYRKAAEQGNADGEFGLGSMYASGEGIKKDPAEALKWITLAAEKGHTGAVKALAHAYLFGTLGLDEKARNDEKATRWIKLAAENGDIDSIEGLAKAYRSGSFGLTADPKQAQEWEAKAKALRTKTNAARKDKK